MTDTVTIALATKAALDQAIRTRLHSRRWYRRQPDPTYWTDLARENDAALRELVRVARLGRTVGRDIIRDDARRRAAEQAGDHFLRVVS